MPHKLCQATQNHHIIIIIFLIIFFLSYSSTTIPPMLWHWPSGLTPTSPHLPLPLSPQKVHNRLLTAVLTLIPSPLAFQLYQKKHHNESYLLTWPDQMFATTFTMNEYLCWVLVTNRWCCPGGVFILFFITNRLLSASKQFKLVLIAVTCCNSAQNYREWVPQKKTKMIDK